MLKSNYYFAIVLHLHTFAIVLHFFNFKQRIMRTNCNLFLLVLALVIGFTSCKKKEEDPKASNESELITTVKLKFTEGGISRNFSFRDLDGAGGTAPVIDNISLVNGKTYALEIEVLDESNPSKINNKTSEILEEGDEHQFFFTGTAASNLLTFAYSDRDKNSRPIGLKSTVTVKAVGNGQLTLTLRHKPNKTAANVASGQIANAGGETDIEVNFNVLVQ